MKTIMVNKITGQSTIEYAVTIGVFVAAIVVMAALLRAHIQGNWRQNIDTFSDEQYAEGLTTSNYKLSIADEGIKIKEGDTLYGKSYEGDLGCYVWRK
jgi:hypothetical protein